MSTNKYDMTEAAAKRIGKVLIDEGMNMRYDSIVEALNAENFTHPRRKVADLITTFQALGWTGLAVSVGRFAAREADSQYEAITSFKHGLQGLGFLLDSDVKTDARIL